MGGPRAERDAPIETIEFARLASLPGVEVMTVHGSRRLFQQYHEAYTVCTLLDAGSRGGLEWAYRGSTHRAARAR